MCSTISWRLQDGSTLLSTLLSQHLDAARPLRRKVKSQKAEALLPAFDLGKKVGRKMALQKFRRPVVLCVVDMADFDGSLPRHALLSLLPQ